METTKRKTQTHSLAWFSWRKRIFTGLPFLALLAVSIATAGEDELAEAAENHEDTAGTSTSLSTGYLSHYFFYGVDSGHNGVWTSLETTLPGTPLHIGYWYIDFSPLPGSPYSDELDLFATVAGEFGGFGVALTGMGYVFPEYGADEGFELAIEISRELGPIAWSADIHYDFVLLEGWYFHSQLTRSIPLSDRVSLSTTVGLSYQIDYYAPGEGFNHSYVTLALPIQLSARAVFEPHFSGLIALEKIDDFQSDQVFGGFSLSISF